MGKVKKLFNRILIILLVIITVTSLFAKPISYAENKSNDTLGGDAVQGILGGLIGILTIPERLIAVLLGHMLNVFTARVAYVDGATDSSANADIITPFDILFNKVMLTDVDFTNVNATNATSISSKFYKAGNGEITKAFRANIAAWYYTMRMIAAAILLVILIYVGIRMLLSTIASDRAKYKKMLVDWITSLCLLFLLQYIIIFVVIINNAIINGLSQLGDASKVDGAIQEIKKFAFSWKHLADPYSIAAAIAYLLLMWQTLTLFFTYFNRMLKLAFLVIISPLITLTYSIDKIGDGKAQALGTWLNEYVFGVLIQPFHCAIYMMFVGTAMDQFTKNTGKDNLADILAASILVIVSVQFIKKAEGIVREIFAFKDDSSNTSLASGVAAAAFTVQMIKTTGGAAKAVKNGAQNFIPGAKNLIHHGKVSAAMVFRRPETIAAAVGMGAASAGTGGTTAQRAGSGSNPEEEEKKTAAERHKERRRLAEMYVSKKEADKFEKKIQGKLSSEAHSKIDQKIKNKKADLIAQSGGRLSEQEALQQARRSVLKEEKDKRNFINRHPKIVGVKQGVHKLTGAYKNSALMQMARDKMKNSIAVGFGAFAATGAYTAKGDIFGAVIAGATAVSSVKDVADSGQAKQASKASSAFNAAGKGGLNSSDRIKFAEEVEADGDKYKSVEAVDKELDKILKDLDKFKNSGFTEMNTKVNVKNQLMDRINEDSSSAADSVDEILKHYNIPTDGEGADLSKALKEYCGRKAIYDQVASVRANGGTIDQYVSMSMGMSDKDEFYRSAIEAAGQVPPKTKYGNVQSIDELKERGKAPKEEFEQQVETLTRENEAQIAEDDAAVENNSMTREEADSRRKDRESEIERVKQLANETEQEAFLEKQAEEYTERILRSANAEAAMEIQAEQEKLYESITKKMSELDAETQSKIQSKLAEKREQVKLAVEQRVSQYVRQKQSELDAASVEELTKYQKILEESQNATRNRQAELLKRRIERAQNNN